MSSSARRCCSSTSTLCWRASADPRNVTRPRFEVESSRCALAIRCCYSDRSNFGEPPDCELVVPADGGFPCSPCLRGNVARVVVETGGVVWQRQVEVGDVDVRLVP